MVVIIVHGGAGNSKPETFEARINGVITAAKKGYQQLIKNDQSLNNQALDAVVEAAVSMEDNPIFNSAYGSSLTIDGTVENDAFVMNGNDMNVGAVASVKKFKNPVKVARLIMEKSDHCILSGEGAHRFAEENGITLIENNELIHQNALNRLANCKSFAETIKEAMNNSKPILNKNLNNNHRFENQILIENELNKMVKLEQMADHDTVGACAIDRLGNLACATTTGGLTAKAVGRIGDSPLAGSGGWADENCAISTTGHGEQIMRVALAKHIASKLEQLYKENNREDGTNKLSNKEIVEKSVECGLNFMKDKVNGFGGVIMLDKNEEFTAQFSTVNMPFACIKSINEEDRKKITLYYGILPNEIVEKELNDSDLVV